MTADRAHQPLSFGAELGEDQDTRFRLWAPSAEVVPAVAFADGSEVPMRAERDGWYVATTRAPAGTAYRYRIAADLLVPDPAARAQQDDVHGWSLVVDPSAYLWRHPDWRGRPWRETVLYELHVGAFAGTFAGVERELERLSALGVTAIELMPVADFPGARNWGYDGVLPFAVEHSYGSPEALKHLVDAAHGLGLMLFLDVVYNHFGPDGNYLNRYAAPFFSADATTPWGPAINFGAPQVRRFFIENAFYWLRDYRIDGLRFDAAHAIDAEFLAELARRVRAELGHGHHVHLVLEHDGNAAELLAPGLFDAQWNDDAHHALHVLLTGERDGYYADYVATPAHHLARCLGQGFAYQGEPSAHRGGAARGTPSAHLPPRAFVLFLQNHDQVGNRAEGDRRMAIVDPAVRHAALALQLLAPGIPMLFMGDEWATRRPFPYFTAHHAELAAAVRDGRRREFARFAAFRDACPPDPNDPATFAAARLDPAEARLPEHAAELALHRQLLAIRAAHITPALDGAIALGGDALGSAAVRAAWRLGDGRTLLVHCNLGPDAVRTPPSTAGRVLHATSIHATASLAGGTLAAATTIWQVFGEAS